MSWPEWLPIRDSLRPLKPYGAPQIPAKIRNNTNENPVGPKPELVKAIAKRVEEVAADLNRYPDRDAINLREKLAKYLGSNLNVENIWAANGSNEIIQSIFLAFGSGKALGFTPSYSMHPLIARVAGVEWINGERGENFEFKLGSAIAKIAETKPKLVFLTTPNNPTGDAISISEIENLAIETAKVGGLLVVDEAYAEFSDEVSAITLISKYPNVLVSRTMSKAFAFAGVRLGYLAANKEVINALMLVRLPYHLSALTQSAAEVALDFKDSLLATVGELKIQRDLLSKKLKDLGLTVIPSSANFLLFTGFTGDSKTLWDKLLAAGVLIRDVGLPGYLRVTIGTKEENEYFIKAIKEVLNA